MEANYTFVFGTLYMIFFKYKIMQKALVKEKMPCDYVSMIFQ